MMRAVEFWGVDLRYGGANAGVEGVREKGGSLTPSHADKFR